MSPETGAREDKKGLPAPRVSRAGPVLLVPRVPLGATLRRATGAALARMGTQAALASLGSLARLARRAPQGGLAFAESGESEDLKAQRGSRENPERSLAGRAQAFLAGKGTLDLRAPPDLVAHWGTQDPAVPRDLLEQL